MVTPPLRSWMSSVGSSGEQLNAHRRNAHQVELDAVVARPPVRFGDRCAEGAVVGRVGADAVARRRIGVSAVVSTTKLGPAEAAGHGGRLERNARAHREGSRSGRAPAGVARRARVH